ncbi:MAG TPA: molybdopterin cofactor-binding domain-containing protein [Candidatus Acidoferrum sp.]|nr:molybdopterin cofactor-binding domain-containing protein [Candidatus Acidoferrum sp.]
MRAEIKSEAAAQIHLSLNGEVREVRSDPRSRLSQVLREEFHLVGTKVGCDAGDCGACTVLVNGQPVCSCLTAVGQLAGATIETIEGLRESSPTFDRLQRSFLQHGAAQCGICTPGMLVSAVALFEENASPDEAQVMDALGGVLCRCTGYRKIIRAVLNANQPHPESKTTTTDGAVGQRVARLDGRKKVLGQDIFGADEWPEDSLLLRVVRSPHHRAEFAFGDLEAYRQAHPGIHGIFTARDVPGKNCFGVIPQFSDQPVFAEREARFLGEAIAAVVGDSAAISALDLSQFPISWKPLQAITHPEEALKPGASAVHASRPDNILVGGRVACGDVDAALRAADVSVEAEYETGFIEHAYIEPEAGFARRVGDRIEIQACTQAPYNDLKDIAVILGIPESSVRIIPTAVGGGFGSKLDLSLQPFLAVAAWHLRKPVRMVYSRPESIRSTTKRHPSKIVCRAGATSEGKLVAMDFSADFNTGAYASWGPTVAARVPIHASGPYKVPHFRAVTRAVHTYLVPAGAFRGFGVPQGTIAQEQLYDALAEKVSMDKLEFRWLNALDGGSPTVTGQIIGGGVGIRACFEALRPRWQQARQEAAVFNAASRNSFRRGVGVAGMWYGCGNTSLPNPSTMRVGLKRDGRIALHQGAVDIGQGSATVVTQICAEALGAPLEKFDLLSGDTDITPDCGKTSASRQTFVSGKAAYLAGEQLKKKILKITGGCDCAKIHFLEGCLTIEDAGKTKSFDLRQLPLDERGYVVSAEATFDPATSPLNNDGQGIPYAVYGFGAHLAELEVDTELGTIKVLKITAAHDVGRAINPTLVEGQIEGGAAQGLGMALMEEFFPGKGENLHDYLIPTIGDMPPVETILIEDPSSAGPFGAKGVGEQALIPTAPAILNALYDAAGVRIRKLPATPDKVRAAILAKSAGNSADSGNSHA